MPASVGFSLRCVRGVACVGRKRCGGCASCLGTQSYPLRWVLAAVCPCPVWPGRLVWLQYVLVSAGCCSAGCPGGHPAAVGRTAVRSRGRQSFLYITMAMQSNTQWYGWVVAGVPAAIQEGLERRGINQRLVGLLGTTEAEASGSIRAILAISPLSMRQ